METQQFHKQQLLESKTLGYTYDLWNAVLEEGRLYSKQEAIERMKEYLTKDLSRKENE